MTRDRVQHNHVFQAEDGMDVDIFRDMGCGACALIRPPALAEATFTLIRFSDLEQVADLIGPTPTPQGG